MKIPISRVSVLIGFAIAILVLAQGISAPFVKDAEPQAAEWIQDVASGGDLLVPRDYYHELARKPPLFYWAAGAVSALSGGRVDEIRARVVSVLAGAAIAIMVLLWAGAFIDAATGWLAFLFLLGSYAFASRGTLALEDMTLLMFVFAAWCLLYPTLEGAPSSRRIIAIGVLLGLGVMTKGPVAIILPAFGAVIYLLFTRRSLIQEIRKPWPWMVLAIAVAVALPWYAAALLTGGAQVTRIIFQENAGHFLPASAGGTGEAARPIYYIALKMLGGITPLNFLLPALLVAFVRGGFLAKTRKPLMFQLSFVVAIVIFFSLASVKRDDYVLPGIPSLAIVFAALFTCLRHDGDAIARRLRDTAAIIVALMAIGGLAVLSLAGGSEILMKNINPIDMAAVGVCLGYARTLNLAFLVAAAAIVAGAALISYGVLRRRPHLTGVGWATISLVGVMAFTRVIRPELAGRRTVKFAAPEIDRIVGKTPLYAVNEEYELSFYIGRALPVMIGPHNAIRKIEAPAYLFVYPPDLNGPGAPLRDRLKMVQQWPRLGKAGPPALYEFEPEGLKPGNPQDK